MHILPPLHRSTINFFGMLPRSKYLATRRYKDKFYALDIYSRLCTWNMATGKLISIKQALNTELEAELYYKGYAVFGFETKDQTDYTYVREWNQPYSLIYDTKTVEKVPDQCNNDNRKTISYIKGSTSYSKSEETKISPTRFKFIQIIDDSHIEEKIEFIHNHYKAKGA